jgi:hypothetical protein
MSQRAVEGVLGRLITDAEFRDEFFRDPARTCEQRVKEAPTPQEVDALRRIDQHALSQIAVLLDPKIVREVGVSVSRAGRTA